VEFQENLTKGSRKTPKKGSRNLREENADNEMFARIGDSEDRRADV